MLDIRRLRNEAEAVKAALAKRGEDFAPVVDEMLRLDRDRREAITEVNELKARRNEVSRRIGELKRAGENADDMIAEMRGVNETIEELDLRASEAEQGVEERLLGVPNVPLDRVPAGGEEKNRILSEWGEPRDFPFDLRPHWEVAAGLGVLDLPRGARVSGSGFPVLRGAGARLQRVLIDHFLDHHVADGYEELRVPYLVTTESMTGTGQLPKFADDSYGVQRDDLWLIPTAEVPVTNLHGGELLSVEELPARFTAYSPCFRREAGSAGKDTRGLLRVHQFDKVELVHYERPEDALDGLEALTRRAEALLEELEIPYRRVLLAAGDLGFSAALTYDLEIWAPGVEQWLEVSSCSTFTDYQARRADLRYRPAPNEKPVHLHTLNGSALALPRLLAAIFETYQRQDGSVEIPAALRDRFGSDRIERPEDPGR